MNDAGIIGPAPKFPFTVTTFARLVTLKRGLQHPQCEGARGEPRRTMSIRKAQSSSGRIYDARKALTESVKGGLPSGSQNRRIIPVYLATARLTRVAGL